MKIGSFDINILLKFSLMDGAFRYFRGMTAVEHEVKLFHVILNNWIEICEG